MKYLLNLAYRGTNYHGWQRQPKHSSVQQTVEEALGKMFRKKIVCTGCGRTDTGVHASSYFAHIRLAEPFEFDFNPAKRLNQILPDDISVFSIEPVPGHFHAQHAAISRSYTYLAHLDKNPFLDGLSAYYGHFELDVRKMSAATSLLTQITDFRSMCKQPHLYKHTNCQFSVASLSLDEKTHKLQFDFTADRFLRNMVRLLVGNIIEVGRGRLSFDALEQCLVNGNRPPFFNLARPEGLYLSGVQYPHRHT